MQDRTPPLHVDARSDILFDPAGWLAWILREELRRWISRQQDLVKLDMESIKISLLINENEVFRIAGRWRPIEFKRFRQKKATMADAGYPGHSGSSFRSQ